RDKTDFRDLDRVEAGGRIDAVAHGAAGEDRGADIVADRVAGETRERGGAIGDFFAADRTQRKPVVKCEREITRGDKQPGGDNVAHRRGVQRLHDLANFDLVQNAVE